MANPDQPPKVAAIVERFQAEHPTAKDVRVSHVSRKQVFLTFRRPGDAYTGLAVREME